MIDLQVIKVRVALSMYEILMVPSSSVSPAINDQFDFILFLAFFNHWWGLFIRHAIGLCLLIWHEEVNVEDIVYLHV